MFAHLTLSASSELKNKKNNNKNSINPFKEEENQQLQKHGLQKLSSIESIKNYNNSSIPQDSLMPLYVNQNTGNYVFQYSSMPNESSSTTTNKNSPILFSTQLSSGGSGTTDNLNCISLFGNTSTTFNLQNSMALNHLNNIGVSNINSYDTRQQMQQTHHSNLSSSIHSNEGFSSKSNFIPKLSVIGGENVGYIENFTNRTYAMHSPRIQNLSSINSFPNYINHAQHQQQHYYLSHHQLSQTPTMPLASASNNLPYNKLDSSNNTSPMEATSTITSQNLFFNEYAR